MVSKGIHTSKKALNFARNECSYNVSFLFFSSPSRAANLEDKKFVAKEAIIYMVRRRTGRKDN
jgi:hypothetical protein